MSNAEEKWWIREGNRKVFAGPYASREESEAELAKFKQDAAYKAINLYVEATPAWPKQNPFAG